MVHARYGSKDADPRGHLPARVRQAQLSPEPDPEATGLQQALGHFDRIGQLFAEDPDFLRAMFVATFEAVKTHFAAAPARRSAGSTSASTEGRGGTRDGDRATDRCGATSTSTAPINDISAAVFGIAYLWTRAGGWLRPRTRAGIRPRARLIRDYGSTCSLTPREEPLRGLLDPAGEEMPDVASRDASTARRPIVRAALGGFAHRHPVVPGADDEAAVRRRRSARRPCGRRRTPPPPRCRTAAARWCRRTDGPHRPRCWAIIALSPKIGVYTATPSTFSRCETSAATGLPIDTPDTAIARGLRPQPSHDRADLGHHAHHARDVGQRIHVRDRSATRRARAPWPGWTGSAMLNPSSS